MIELKPLNPYDAVNPEYYNNSKFSPWDVIEDWNLNFNLGSCMKYIKRAGNKPGNSKVQDLKKVIAYVQREIELTERKG